MLWRIFFPACHDCLIWPDATADEYKISGAHLTFNLPEEGDALESLGYLRRTGIQYHWTNNDYGCFDDFLADLKQPKRNNIRKVSIIRAS